MALYTGKEFISGRVSFMSQGSLPSKCPQRLESAYERQGGSKDRSKDAFDTPSRRLLYILLTDT
ncbi:hypothetical protein WG66_016888 [Moniliophthora roreri]|nr:hypothetical protein WG66_016888 [Moniliophthora roreri]